MESHKTVAFLHEYEERKITAFIWARKHYELAQTNESITFFWRRMLKAGFLALTAREEKHKLLGGMRVLPAVDAIADYYWRAVLGPQNYMMQSPFMEEIDQLLELRRMQEELGIDPDAVSENQTRLAQIRQAVESRKKKRMKRVSKDTRRIVEEGMREQVQSKIAEFLHGGPVEEVTETYKIKRGMCICLDGDKVTRVLKVTKLPYIEPTEVNRWL